MLDRRPGERRQVQQNSRANVVAIGSYPRDLNDIRSDTSPRLINLPEKLFLSQEWPADPHPGGNARRSRSCRFLRRLLRVRKCSAVCDCPPADSLRKLGDRFAVRLFISSKRPSWNAPSDNSACHRRPPGSAGWLRRIFPEAPASRLSCCALPHNSGCSPGPYEKHPQLRGSAAG